MIKNYKKRKNNALKMCAMFMFPFSLFGGLLLCNQSKASAVNETTGYHIENVSVSNSDFTQGGSTYTSGNSLSGWNAIETDNKASGMLISVGNNVDNQDFEDDYYLHHNPESFYKNDQRIMMINAKTASSESDAKKAFKGYRSSTISLEANSFYTFSVAARTMAHSSDATDVFASIYVSGLKDEDGQEVKLGIERITSSAWKEYYFFIATGNESQSVTLDLYLGTSSEASQGAVFFDHFVATRYSENLFHENLENFGYTADNFESMDNETVFIVDKFLPQYQLIEGSENYNFDFEDELTEKALGDKWQIISGKRHNANAEIMDIRDRSSISSWTNKTGYDFIGDDYSNDNHNGLVLWANEDGGYIGVKSQDISLNAHDIYKITLNLKLTGIENGSFYVNVSENDKIYSYEQIEKEEDNEDNFYTLLSSKTSGFTSNTTNEWKNDYQTIEFYVKGHSLYNSSFNIEFWLGDETTQTKGLAVVDNIKVEYSNYNDFENTTSSNKLELVYEEYENSSTNNGLFNLAQNTEGKYPLAASNWTATKGNDKLNESGIVYLSTNEEYDKLYPREKYDWAGINPNSDSETPNNVYMMFNRQPSYQSLQSGTYSLSENSFYKLSFDYYTQDYLKSISKIKVEISDENGITLFSKSDISSPDKFTKMEIYLHSAEIISHTISVKIYLGEENHEVGGYVYLDNFAFEQMSDMTEDTFAVKENKADLTNYLLNLEGETDSTPSFTFSVDETFDGSSTSSTLNEGKIVSGKNNGYGIENENNILAIKNLTPATSSLTSKYKFTLGENSYYKLTFDLATIFGDEASSAESKDKDHVCEYGVKVNLDGFNEIKGIVGTRELKTYTIFFNSSTSSTSAISFSLVSDCEQTLGVALITNLNLASATENEYNTAQTVYGDKFGSTVFTSAKADTAEEEPSEDDEDDTDDSTSDSTFDSRWLLISSIIMGVALIIAIVGFILRKIKIKKIERIKNEAYDRKLSLNHDVILKEAQARRDEEVKSLQKAKQVLAQDRVELEEKHKEFLRENRESSQGKLSREVERAFKKYNNDIARIDEKINILQEKIDFCMTADYLLTIERKIVAEEEDKFASEKRAYKKSKKENKSK